MLAAMHERHDVIESQLGWFDRLTADVTDGRITLDHESEIDTTLNFAAIGVHATYRRGASTTQCLARQRTQLVET
jgi:hypothetical protein